MEPLHTPPETSSFVLLSDHQSRTPASFHSGPPVLHYHSRRCRLVVFERDIVSVPALNAIRADSASASANGNGAIENSDEGKEIVIDGVDVWVTSEYAPLQTSTIVFLKGQKGDKKTNKIVNSFFTHPLPLKASRSLIPRSHYTPSSVYNPPDHPKKSRVSICRSRAPPHLHPAKTTRRIVSP